MKVGIVTFHRAHNCGAALQCVALQTVLQRSGFDTRVLDCNNVGDGLRDRLFIPRNWTELKLIIRRAQNIMKPARRRYVRFMRRFMNLSERCYGAPEMIACDCYVLGSDQVLNPMFIEGYRTVFLLAGLSPTQKRIAYAVSFGVRSLPEEERKLFKTSLSLFSSIGVREKDGVRICRDELGIEKPIYHVLDPTLLLDASDYRMFESPVYIKGRYVLIYHLGWSLEHTLRFAKSIASLLEARVVVASLIMNHEQIPGVTWLFPGPGEFLWLIRNAQFVVTTSFHGTVFSILNHIPFITVAPKDLKVGGRLEDLLARVGLSYRLVSESHDMSGVEAEKIIHPLDMCIDDYIAKLREESLGFLTNALL